MLADGRKSSALPHARVRTALGNGGELAGVDGRSLIARRYRELAALISRDASPNADLTEAQKQLIRSAAGLIVLRERLDVKAIKGEKIDCGEYCGITNTLRRVLVTIGLGRTPREVNANAYDDEIDAHYARACAELDREEAPQP
jgi:hypothetical protein